MKKVIILSMLLFMGTVLMGQKMKIRGDTHFQLAFEDMDNNEFSMSRAYFTVQNKVSKNIAYKFQTDIGSGGPSAYSLYLKNAKIDWKTDFAKVTIGLQGMNMFKIQENNWGYRFIEKSVMDRKKFSSSADLGIGLEKSLGTVSLSALITNGTGYKKTEDDNYKKISTRLMLGESKLNEGFNAGVVFSYEGEDYEAINSATTDTSIATGNTIVIGGFGGIILGPLKLGGEYAMLTQTSAYTASKSTLSLYANYIITKNLAGFGRFDVFGMDTEGGGEQYFILGANYTPEKALSIAPNVLIEIPEGGESEMTYRLSFRFKI